MFTGIVECVGEVTGITEEGSNLSFTVKSPISHELSIDQSVSHNGVCLTVVATHEGTHVVTAIHETLIKSNIGELKTGDLVNLERCMPANGRFDGHIVQGHVDTVATCLNIKNQNGSWEYEFSVEDSNAHLIVNKGSVCLNGTSLTCYDTTNKSFKVSIIPYTYDHTVFKTMQVNDKINIEFDIIGKYLEKIIDMRT